MVDEPPKIHNTPHLAKRDSPPRRWLRVLLVCGVLAVGYWIVVRIWLAPADARRHLETQLMALDLPAVARNPAVFEFAVARGRAAFKENCASCHGPAGQGAPGVPNLTDSDWLWGGTFSAIEQTITHGIRNEDRAGRFSEMPAFLRDGLLTAAQVDDVVEYVLLLSGQKADAEAAKRGAQVFSENCANCHSPDGKGDPSIGAPNLTDSIWLYGGDRASLRQTVSTARNSSMPSWSGRLPPATIRALAVYVHNLGGGQPEAGP